MEDLPANHLKRRDDSILARANQIDQIGWADQLSHKQSVILAGYMDSYETERGRIILQEGGKDAHLLLVVSGQVEILKSETEEGAKTVATIGPGESFGEMSLIDGEPRSASAVAATPVSLLMLSKEEFTRLNGEHPRLGVVLLFKFAKLMSQHLRQTTGRLVEHL